VVRKITMDLTECRSGVNGASHFSAVDLPRPPLHRLAIVCRQEGYPNDALPGGWMWISLPFAT
jgi:hypothetical protein